jgi:putative endonuclease
MFYVYILQSKKDGDLYTGFTNDLKRRIYEHNAGKNISTSYRKPLKLIYYEAYLDKEDALGRELFLKSGSGHRFIKKQLTHYLANKN